MEQKINIDNLDDLQKQALVCMYYAMLPKTDARYKKRIPRCGVTAVLCRPPYSE